MQKLMGTGQINFKILQVKSHFLCTFGVKIHGWRGWLGWRDLPFFFTAGG
jgi:hypothetical protein